MWFKWSWIFTDLGDLSRCWHVEMSCIFNALFCRLHPKSKNIKASSNAHYTESSYSFHFILLWFKEESCRELNYSSFTILDALFDALWRWRMIDYYIINKMNYKPSAKLTVFTLFSFLVSFAFRPTAGIQISFCLTTFYWLFHYFSLLTKQWI